MRYALATAALIGASAALEATVEGGLPKPIWDEWDQVQRNAWTARGFAKVVNRCPYDVYLWSINKQLGCNAGDSTKLSTGQSYQEKMLYGDNGGISLKLSKFDTCGGKDITQLEYKLDVTNKYGGNYLDMSFVDCLNNLEDCPGRTDGFYLKAGSQSGVFKSAENNEHCPVFNVYNAEEAVKVSYVKWDDRQTKFCDMSQNLDLYLCGGDAPGDEDESAPASSVAPSSSEIEISSTPEPTSTKKQKPAPVATSSAEEEFVVAAAAAVTEAPAAPPAPVIKTEVVYVTKYVDRRHEHARRHQRFHA